MHFFREPHSFESNGIMGNTDDNLDKKATIKWQTEFASSSASRNNKAALVAGCRITWIPKMVENIKKFFVKFSDLSLISLMIGLPNNK